MLSKDPSQNILKEAMSLFYSCLFYKNTNAWEGNDNFSQHSVVIKSNCSLQAASFQYDPVIRRNWKGLHFNWNTFLSRTELWSMKKAQWWPLFVFPSGALIWTSVIILSDFWLCKDPESQSQLILVLCFMQKNKIPPITTFAFCGIALFKSIIG